MKRSFWLEQGHRLPSLSMQLCGNVATGTSKQDERLRPLIKAYKSLSFLFQKKEKAEIKAYERTRGSRWSYLSQRNSPAEIMLHTNAPRLDAIMCSHACDAAAALSRPCCNCGECALMSRSQSIQRGKHKASMLAGALHLSTMTSMNLHSYSEAV